MKLKSVFAFAVMLTVFSLAIALPVSADIGPKPSVNIEFKNLGGERCYATLLSEKRTSGPFSADDHEVPDCDDSISHAFADYDDDYYFLWVFWEISGTERLVWGYYPPKSFKILLYFPDSGIYAESEVCESYAFDSYFTVDMAEATDNGGDLLIRAYRSYDYTNELLSLFARIIITIAIEVGAGLLFGLRSKKEIVFILAVNAVTQIGLNVALNVISYFSGGLVTMFWFVALEILIVIAEAAFYCAFMRRYTKRKSALLLIAYAVAANALSFGAGLLTAHLIPSIF